jgi:signal transduction histidine kinase
MKTISPRFAWQLFIVSILLLLAFAYYGLSRAEQFRQSQAWVVHTLQVEAEIARLRADIATASASSYQIPTDPTALARYTAAVHAIDGGLDTLQTLTADNSVQQGNIAKLRLAVQAEMQAIAENLPTVPAAQRTAAEKIEPQLGDATAVTLNAMRMEEEQLLGTRTIISDRDRQTLRIAIVSGMLVVLGVMIFAFRTILLQLSLRESAERAVRRLSAHILRIQDAERRRLARDLHDGIGQTFVGLRMTLESLKASPRDEAQKQSLEGAFELAQDGLSQTRTLSYLLHPPMLEEFGLEQAATWYVEGFAKRSHLPVDLKFSQPFRRLPEALELVLFRVIQESLANVHKHSGSKRAEISVTAYPDRVAMVIRDYGKGIPEDLLKSIQQSSSGAGVGLGGMRERVAELDGRLLLASSPQGTAVNVSLPIPVEQKARATGGSDPIVPAVERPRPSSEKDDPTGYSREALGY